MSTPQPSALPPCTDASALAEAIAHRCKSPQQHGVQWQACCPAHDDHTPSLSITPTADKVLVYCHAQCPTDAILAALGLTMRDLFVHSSTQRNGHKHIVKAYDYNDASGTLVHQTVRFEPKEFRQRRPDPANPGAWILEPQRDAAGALPLVSGPPGHTAGGSSLPGRGRKRRRDHGMGSLE